MNGILKRRHKGGQQENDLNTQLMANARNLPINQEIMNCDAAIVPTEWQREQFQ